MTKIRKATLKDLKGITDIYNDAIMKTNATFDTEPKTEEEQKRWFKEHGSKYPIAVAEKGRLIIGWASLSPWSDRCAYSNTAEISVYVKDGHRGKGIGKQLIKTVLREGRDVGLHTVIARVSEGNETSIRLLETFGFDHIGIMKEVGRKFGKQFDVYLMQKIYE